MYGSVHNASCLMPHPDKGDLSVLILYHCWWNAKTKCDVLTPGGKKLQSILDHHRRQHSVLMYFIQDISVGSWYFQAIFIFRSERLVHVMLAFASTLTVNMYVGQGSQDHWLHACSWSASLYLWVHASRDTGGWSLFFHPSTAKLQISMTAG